MEYLDRFLSLVCFAVVGLQFGAYGFDTGDFEFIAYEADTLDEFNIGESVEAVSVPILAGGKGGELCLPVAKGRAGRPVICCVSRML